MNHRFTFPGHAGYRTMSLLLVFLMIFFASCEDNGPRVLVFSKTKGWQHSSIPFANDAIEKLGEENGYDVDLTTDASRFNDDVLHKYDAVIFNNTTGNVLNAEQQAAFERYIQAGGGYVGIHSASDTEYEWPWYGELMGAHFSSHPHNPNVQSATIHVTDKDHPSTKGLPDDWERTDEWYNFRYFYPGINVLAYLDEETYTGGTNGDNHPIAWYHEYDGGRAFYTNSGHEDASFSEPLFLEHLQGGIAYAMGTGRNLDYSRATAVAAPEPNRFEKSILINDLSIPMELDIADDGRIFYTELRSGKLGYYDTNTGQHGVVHNFDVTVKGGSGLIGVTLDPHFATNKFIYLFYTPAGQEREPYLFNLSRFVLNDNNTLDPASEQVFLTVPVQEKGGSHYGGSLAWDEDGNLFLSTGDSSNPFPADGYAPLDERPGEEYFSLDAQRSAGNTNDLKGKILRITPQYDPDGPLYTIPDGNLFAKGEENTRPEIYVMGCRNPYRIAVNSETGTVYWGDIGPDAGEDGPQGPKGYDEFNQAKTAGNFGWPYFIGNNRPYNDWDFSSEERGPAFDPAAPINESPNNTGLKQLPPAQPAMIYYPYSASEEFPDFGSGGRSAMAGEFYEYDENSEAPTRFPEFYDGKLFVFEWMRNWVKALQFDENENYVRAHSFMSENGDFRRPIDLTFGKDGVMYMLEYGSVYGADNEDARLVKIEYNRGNRSPEAVAYVTDSAAEAELSARVFITSERRGLPVITKAMGHAPLRVHFGSRGTHDPDDDDQISYQWFFGVGDDGSNEKSPVHVYETPGVYTARLRVTDQDGMADEDTVLVTVGNSPPEVAFDTKNNRSFFWENEPFVYSLEVTDEEDRAINPARKNVKVTYNPSPSLLAAGANPALTESIPYGLTLIEQNDCKACHMKEEESVGPTYKQVALRYENQDGARSELTQKIIEGGGGNWGEHLMSAHPQLSPVDVGEMVDYILSLSQESASAIELDSQGELQFDQHKDNEERGVYTIAGSYTDGGANGIPPITGYDVLKLRKARVPMVFMDKYEPFERFGDYLTNAEHKAYYMMKHVDLTGISGFTFEYAAEDRTGHIEVRIDSRAGPVIMKIPYTSTGGFDNVEKLTATLDNQISGYHDIYFIPVRPEKPNEDIINLKAVTFNR